MKRPADDKEAAGLQIHHALEAVATTGRRARHR
jgi:hypothetical protein